MSNFKTVWQCLLLVNSISLQYKKEYSCCKHSEILATLESGDGRNNHHMHTIHCPHKIHTQYFQNWTYCDYKNKVKSKEKGQKKSL